MEIPKLQGLDFENVRVEGSCRHGVVHVQKVGVYQDPTHPVRRVLLAHERSHCCRICPLMYSHCLLLCTLFFATGIGGDAHAVAMEAAFFFFVGMVPVPFLLSPAYV